jgi:hypothetical protein
MEKCLYTLILLCSWSTSFAQVNEDLQFTRVGNESMTIYKDRRDITVPSYGIQKIRGLIAQARKEEPGMSTVLSPQIYSALSLREKFTYHMINGETYSQNCSMVMIDRDEQKKIYARLPDIFGLNDWSSRQWDFLRDNRDSVIVFMNSHIVTSISLGANFKRVIVRLNATEMIPLLLSTYNNQKKKDHDILTVLMLLMQDNKYQPFLISNVYTRLYKSKESSYKRYLDFNAADEVLILQHAIDLYSGLPKKN